MNTKLGKMLTYCERLSSVSEDTSHTCYNHNPSNIEKTSVGPSKNTDEKEKETKKRGNCKAFCISLKCKKKKKKNKKSKRLRVDPRPEVGTLPSLVTISLVKVKIQIFLNCHHMTLHWSRDQNIM